MPGTTSSHRPSRLVAAAIAFAVCTSCGSGSGSESDAAPASASPGDSTYPSSIVAMGHSGLTGFGSDPELPMVDTTANSWATGTNPDVDSIYLRVLAKNPAVKGHVENVAIDGSNVDSLVDQEKLAAAVTPTPDLVIIQSIDNDIRCDGTDPQNYTPFRHQLTAVMDSVTQDMPDADIFFVSQWATVKEYDRAAVEIDPSHVTGTGPCDAIDLETYKLNPKHEKYLQHLVDHYWKIVTAVCAEYPTCRTDKGLMQTMKLDKADLASDVNHLSVVGHHKMAALAWQALYG